MKKNIILGLGGAVAVLACASSAYATTTDAIRWSTDGTTWLAANEVVDGGVGDGNALNGVINANFTIGGYTITVVSTETFPVLGTAASPRIDLDVQGAAALGTIYIEFSATGYTPLPTGSFITTLGGTSDAGISETVTTRVGANTLFDSTGVSFAPIGPFTSGATMSGSGTDPALTAPYSITLKEAITTTGGTIISFDDTLKVPDGGNTLMLLGSALSVLGLGVFRNTRKAVKA